MEILEWFKASNKSVNDRLNGVAIMYSILFIIPLTILSLFSIKRPCSKNFQDFTWTHFNFLFQISGLGILIAGSVVIHDTSDYGHFIDGKITAPPIILIVLGILILVIATLGCYGALKESPKYLMAVSYWDI